MSRLLPFLAANARWLAAGFLMALASSFGQTFFIAIFSDSLRAEFDLSHGDFGLIYMVATLASAATIVHLGTLADTMNERKLAIGVLIALAAVCLFMASIVHWFMLVLAIYGLRLFGQGMISHAAQTFTARWFHATRGKALAVTTFGYPVGEAFAPIIAVGLILSLGWREAWGIAAVVLLMVVLPILWVLLSKPRIPNADALPGASGMGLGGRHWTRAEVIRSPLFWLIVPCILGPSFILTVIFFLPSHIAETKGWEFTLLPATYPLYALVSVCASFAYGFLIDRFSARACLPFYQLPMVVALIVLWLGTSEMTIVWLMILIGMTSGGAATLHSAIWAEFYGTQHLGSIKALAHAVMVFATAAGPGICSLLIDAGFDFSEQAPVFALYTVGVCALYAAIAWNGLGGRTAPTTSPAS